MIRSLLFFSGVAESVLADGQTVLAVGQNHATSQPLALLLAGREAPYDAYRMPPPHGYFDPQRGQRWVAAGRHAGGGWTLLGRDGMLANIRPRAATLYLGPWGGPWTTTGTPFQEAYRDDPCYPWPADVDAVRILAHPRFGVALPADDAVPLAGWLSPSRWWPWVCDQFSLSGGSPTPPKRHRENRHPAAFLAAARWLKAWQDGCDERVLKPDMRHPDMVAEWVVECDGVSYPMPGRVVGVALGGGGSLAHALLADGTVVTWDI